MKTVFHCSSDEDSDRTHALANVRNLLRDETFDLETTALVANGSAVEMLAEGSALAERVDALIEDGVAFFACANSLNNRDIEPTDLLSGVETTSSGVGGLTKLQADEYHYIKVP